MKPSFPKLDDAERVKLLLGVFKDFKSKIESAEWLLNMYSIIFGKSSSPDSSNKPLIDGAKDFPTHTQDYKYIIMGHTHNPIQVTI